MVQLEKIDSDINGALRVSTCDTLNSHLAPIDTLQTWRLWVLTAFRSSRTLIMERRLVVTLIGSRNVIGRVEVEEARWLQGT